MIAFVLVVSRTMLDADMPSGFPRVLASFFWSDEALQRGVTRYADEHGWEIVSDSPAARHGIGGPLDGFIGMLPPEPDHPTRRRVADLGHRVTEMSLAYPENKDWMRYPEDCEAIGRAAASRLRKLPVRSFAFVDDTPWWNHDARFAALAEGLRGDARPLRRIHFRNAADWSENATADTLSALPKPCGVFCSTDGWARKLIRIANATGLSVPGDLFVLGFGDSDTRTFGSASPVSSIAFDTEAWAYAAAGMLDEAMTGRVAPGTVRLFAPGKIIDRESTGGDGAGDPLCERAVALMRDNIRTPLNTAELAARLDVSISTLERKFDSRLGKGVGRRYLELRMEIAQGLLAAGEKAEFVAASVGYSSYRAFSLSFRNITGHTPRAAKKPL